MSDTVAPGRVAGSVPQGAGASEGRGVTVAGGRGPGEVCAETVGERRKRAARLKIGRIRLILFDNGSNDFEHPSIFII